MQQIIELAMKEDFQFGEETFCELTNKQATSRIFRVSIVCLYICK